MDSERWRRINDIFHRVVDLTPRDRSRELDAACAGDERLREEVERLLASDSRGGTDPDGALFERVAARGVTEPGRDPLVGRLVGHYRLVERLGEGGMGVVYRAERADGLFTQDVAVKLIRSERATRATVRRFELERRTLAGLEHPSIARLLDGGTTAEGTPYFVMELVRGEPISLAVERARLGLEARLRLFVEVCRAVHHAHQNLIIHCDLKPANILIDEDGRPRLLDFGIARLLEESPSPSASPATLANILTPEYASPEQLSGGPVTTAIDIYALGVVLYELLAGRRPFESDSRSLLEWERLVREATPTRPSARLEHGTRPWNPSRLRGDLDRIVLMALRAEPERRYSSVAELAEDIERHLDGRPVRARTSSFGYLATKFIGRNRVAVVAALLVLGAVLFALLAAERGARLAQEEAFHAQAEADSFQSIATFLMEGFLPAHPSDDPDWQSRARARVLTQAEQVRRQYVGSEHQRANLIDTLGQVCRRLDLEVDAASLMEEAKSIRERFFGRDSIEYAISLRSLGQLAYDKGEYGRGVELLNEALAIHRAHEGSTHADVAAIANDLAACLRSVGKIDESEALHREALERRTRDSRATLPVAESLNNIAGICFARGRYDEAIEGLREASTIRSSILGPTHILSVQTLSNLGLAYWRAGRADEAIRETRRAEEGYRALGIDGEDGLAVTLSNLSTMQLGTKDAQGAAKSLDEALAIQRKRLHPDHPRLAVSLAKLAAVHQASGHADLARSAWQEAIRIRRVGSDAPRDLAEALVGCAAFLAEVGACSEAGPLVDEALATLVTRSIEDPATRARALFVRGDCLAKGGELAAAVAAISEAIEVSTEAPQLNEAERERFRERLKSLQGAAIDGSH